MPNDTPPDSERIPAALSTVVYGLARGLRVLSVLCLAAMVIVTISDIALRIAFNRLIFGVVEIVEFALVGLVFLAVPEVTLRQEHIEIDVIDRLIPAGAVYLLRLVGALVTLLFFGAMSWRMIPPALDTLTFGGATPELHVHLIWYWLPMIIGIVCGTVAAFVVLLPLVRAGRR